MSTIEGKSLKNGSESDVARTGNQFDSQSLASGSAIILLNFDNFCRDIFTGIAGSENNSSFLRVNTAIRFSATVRLA
jgi:hypothetical protein